jgi:hypothetical protein
MSKVGHPPFRFGGREMATALDGRLQAKTITPSLTVDDLQRSIRFFEGLGFVRRYVDILLNTG